MNDFELPVAKPNSSNQLCGRWWTTESDGRILCQLCPRACRLKPGDRGFCFVRRNVDGQMVLDTYGRSTGFCIDPIEKKPLNHFLPGTPVLSFGTAGCNLGCKFCQNWDISKSREVARLSDRASPEDIAAAAKNSGCRSVAFTYNDPVIWAEYAIDTAAACRANDIRTVAVTAGYIMPEARGDFFAAMDAANIDLKAFTEDFYYKLTSAHLAPVLDTIRYAVQETDCWVELTNLIIPDANDRDDEMRRLCDWVLEAVGDEIPVHFTAFHPDFRMQDRPRTSHATLIAAFDIARQRGLKYPYVGNVHDVNRQSTFCPSCSSLLIQRDWHQIGRYDLNGDQCVHCGYRITGHFEDAPGSWGQKRQPIRISSASANSEMSASQSSVAPSVDENRLPEIHQAACRAVTQIVNGEDFDPAAALGDLANAPISGIFVTLKRGETLRGCCGMQGPKMPLGQALLDSATRTAKHDPRMTPITAIEVPFLNVSVSILGPSRIIKGDGRARVKQVEIGRHGLRIRQGNQAGLLLPSVARERNWNAHQFLDAVCIKAGLPVDSWRRADAEVQVFDGIDYSGPMCEVPQSAPDASPYGEIELERLRAWIQANIIAFQSGATPSYYAAGAPDGEVAGVILRVFPDPNQSPAFAELILSARQPISLQRTLLDLSSAAARSTTDATYVDGWRADVTVLTSLIHHGTATDHDIREVAATHRALIALSSNRWSIEFAPVQPIEATLQRVLASESFRPEQTSVYSACCGSTETAFSLSKGPRASQPADVRPPAVAGTFYPLADLARDAMVDQFLSELPAAKPQPVAAAMVPHAGLKYSGRIATDVWRRIKLPETVLIIGPKHTRQGVDWAVAGHAVWQLSETASMASDVELANRIAETIPGMEIDAAAHAQEHGIEVQLPILSRIAPQTKITAIAMAGGNYAELEKAAGALAQLLQTLEQPPLLIISSDMNHFADDDENRRRDRLALDRLQDDDPQGLLETCAAENISMCGQVPAALVLLTLRAMGQKPNYQEIAYDTSASVSGDKSRVVGYAGVLF